MQTFKAALIFVFNIVSITLMFKTVQTSLSKEGTLSFGLL